jgi:hypothetical protein
MRVKKGVKRKVEGGEDGDKVEREESWTDSGSRTKFIENQDGASRGKK